MDIRQIYSNDNLANLFTKSLSTSTFKRLTCNMRMHQLKNINIKGEYVYEIILMYYSFFLYLDFVSLNLIDKVFNKTVLTSQKHNVYFLFY